MIQRDGAGPVVRVSALVPFLRCPDRRCNMAFTNADTDERYRGVVKCIRSSCRQHWFAEPLEAGSVRHQLENSYLDPAIVNDLMIRLRLPASIAEPMFLQIPLSGELWDGYMKDGDRTRSRSRRLVSRFLDSLHRRAS